MSINFPQAEEETLKLWNEIQAFETQVKLSEGNPRFNFFDGPPFATGLPHYGHLLTSTIKDIIPRYWSMKGRHVIRRFGWDTHGLPIEYEIDKKLGMSGRDAVQQMGIAKYNAECKAIVMTYAHEWRQTITRLGRWIDFDNDYKTMNPEFMESVWWVFKQLYDRDQVYRSYQIMPYSTALNTPLSNFEAQQNYKDTQDPAIIVAFPVVEPAEVKASLLIYTTTPWTLPSNLAIAANPDFEYVRILDEATGNEYYLLESRLSMIYKDPKKAKYKVLGKINGREMDGWKYKPIYDYFVKDYPQAFRVVLADFVVSDEGVGLVHMAPAFGPEDFEASMKAGLISHTVLPPNPIDQKGCFTAEVPDYEGQHVKVAEKAIVKQLRPTGRLVVDTQVTHSVKFCWRSDTPLINKAVSSWFVKVTNSIPDMLKNIAETNWVPTFVKEKRFANWISTARDWNISRNRYWGTPIPLWVSDDYEEIVCVGSIAELKELAGISDDIVDIHRDKIDHITIPSKQGKGQLKRIEEVFDCWFESGSMPYASQHYPFKIKEDFLKSAFPGDFVAEGLDQTRGWFYTLVVLGTKLFGVSPFRNCIVNGIILAESGKKMSKRLKNYPDPSKVINAHGSDALRLYLINSPVVRAEPFRFKEAGVKEVVAKVLLPLWNSYQFFEQQAVLLENTKGVKFVFDPDMDFSTNANVMDRWILANCQSLIKFMDQEMLAYRLYTVVPQLLQLIDNLTNWYIRFNRKRLKGQTGEADSDSINALNTLFEVLFVLVRALAPFVPFLTDHIYRKLAPRLPPKITEKEADLRSVHFLSFPEVKENLFDVDVERRVARMQKVIELSRTAREKCNIGLKTPLMTLVVLADAHYLEDVSSLASYVREELNVRDLVLTFDEQKYDVRLKAVADWARLGEKLKKDTQKVRKGLPGLTNDQLRDYSESGTITIDGITLEKGDLTVVRGVDTAALNTSSGADGPVWEANSDADVIVLLDTKPHPELQDEGTVRDLISRVQRLRKKAGLTPIDDVRMEYAVVKNADNVELEKICDRHAEFIQTAVRGPLQPAASQEKAPAGLIAEDLAELGNLTVTLRLLKL